MFDIGWSEILVIAAVAVLVVGPKELPRMLRSFGKTLGQVRRMSNDFKRQFDDALREAEREVGLEDTKKQLKAMVGDPLKDAQKSVDKAMEPPKAIRMPRPEAAAADPAPMESPAPEPATAGPHEAAPVKTGAVPAEGSDAA